MIKVIYNRREHSLSMSGHADIIIEAYNWQAEGYEAATASRVEAYYEYCESANVPKDIFLEIHHFQSNTKNDVDENGDPIYYSALKKVMQFINDSDLTSEQKTAVALSIWAEKSVKKYKLW